MMATGLRRSRIHASRPRLVPVVSRTASRRLGFMLSTVSRSLGWPPRAVAAVGLGHAHCTRTLGSMKP